MKLNDRLAKIAKEIKTGETMADIGTDHGFLPIYLNVQGISPYVIFSDISRGSLEKAKSNCSEQMIDDNYDCRLGDGLGVLAPAEVDDIVIAGMGGSLISDIMGEDPDLSHSFKRFILQPRNNIGKLRRWLLVNGYEIVNEQMAREGRFICIIITAEYTGKVYDASDKSDAFFEYPPWLLDHRNELTVEYLKRESEKEQKIIDNISKNSSNAGSDSESAREYVHAIEQLLKELS